MAVHSISSIQNTNNRRFWIRKDECTLKFKIDKIYLHVKDPHEAKYQFLINKRESTELKHFNDPKAFIEYSNDMQDVYKNIEKYNPGKSVKYQ